MFDQEPRSAACRLSNSWFNVKDPFISGLLKVSPKSSSLLMSPVCVKPLASHSSCDFRHPSRKKKQQAPIMRAKTAIPQAAPPVIAVVWAACEEGRVVLAKRILSR